jgi:N-methylhydantoinase B
MSKPSTDPITVGVIRSGMISMAREMGVTLRQTAYSSIFNEGTDFSCGMFNAEARLVAQGEFLPVHLGSLQLAVRQAVEEVGFDNFEPGDTVLLNDPFRGGTHLPDMTAITPIFVGEQLVGFAGCRAHHADVGGTVAGSFYSEARENYQEGLRIPPVKLYRRGVVDRDLMEMILDNVRVPHDMRGDLEAQISANRTAVDRLRDMCDRYGVDTVFACQDEICRQSEQRMQRVLESWPDGDYAAEDFLDNDGIVDEPIRIHVTLKVRGDELHVDFDGSSPQAVGPVNCVAGMTASATYLAVHAATDPEIPANDGCYRPITIIAEPGTVVSPLFPAPCTGGNETTVRIANTVQRAMAEIPSGPQLIAGDHGSCNNLLIDTWTDDGRRDVFYQYPEGGWGALDGKDGESAFFTIVGNCKNMPAEALELRFPLRLVRYELRPDTGGAGRHRGGMGTRRDYEILAARASLSFVADRCKTGAFGLDDGDSGGPGAYLIDRGEGFETASPMLSKGSQIELDRGDVVSQQTAGGGGFGDPRLRPLADVRTDFAAGFVSEDQLAAYGASLVDGEVVRDGTASTTEVAS